MSTVRKPYPPRDPRQHDPFFYGWRAMYRVGADGHKEYVQVPAQARAAAEERVRQLEAELRRLRGNPS
jgi:hypothetical protein